jgi:hypothetical protein
MLADGTAINNSGVTVPDGIAGVIASLALDLADNNQLDSNIFAYVSAMATFVQGENNRTNPEVSANLLQLLTDNGNGDTSVGSTEPNIAHWFAGNWFIIEHDDGVRPDGMADDPADEHNSSVTITVNDDGSWNWSTPTSDSLISASKITIDQSRLTATIPDDSGQGRTVLTYNYDNKTIDGQWQKLADDNVTYYKNYETWLMVPPLPCNTVGGPHSHGGFLSAVADCGTQQPFVAEDLVGKTIYFADEPGAQITFDDLGSAFIVRDGGTREYLNWYPDHNGLLELYTNDSSSTIEFRKHIAWLGIDSATGRLKTKVYSEGDTTWPSDFVFDGTADGAISDTAMVVVADIGPNAVQYVGSWASPCLNTAGNPAGAFVMLEITLNYQGEFNDSAIFYSDASCSTMTTSTTSSGTFSMGADIALTNGSTGTALDKHITLENGNAVDKMSYTIAQLPAPGVMLMANEHTSASERDLDTDPFLWWLYYPQ